MLDYLPSSGELAEVCAYHIDDSFEVCKSEMRTLAYYSEQQLPFFTRGRKREGENFICDNLQRNGKPERPWSYVVEAAETFIELRCKQLEDSSPEAFIRLR